LVVPISADADWLTRGRLQIAAEFMVSDEHHREPMPARRD
jgi:hypothetical protein